MSLSLVPIMDYLVLLGCIMGRGCLHWRTLLINSLQEEQFLSRPSVRITLPDNLKAILVDDWENVTKNRQVLALPAPISVNTILDTYAEEERAKRTNPADLDVLEEVIAGIKEYFDKSLDKILLYRFEREQYRLLRHRWEAGSGNFADKGPLDIYGAHHLMRLFGKWDTDSRFLSSCSSSAQLQCLNLLRKPTWTNNPRISFARSFPNSHFG